jgi:hypothetical protein
MLCGEIAVHAELMACVPFFCVRACVLSYQETARFFVHAVSLRLAHKIIESLKPNRVQISFFGEGY